MPELLGISCNSEILETAKADVQYEITSSNRSIKCKADPGTEDLLLQNGGATPHCKCALK